MNNDMIVLDDGVKTYEIVDTKGEKLGEIKLNVNDNRLPERFEKTEMDIRNIVGFIKMELAKGKDPMTVLKKSEKKVADAINYLFDKDIASTFFSITSPFTLLPDGQFFVENVINAIRVLIEDENEKRIKALNDRVKKYTEKYTEK